MKIKKTSKINLELNDKEISLFMEILAHSAVYLAGVDASSLTEKEIEKLKEQKDFIKGLQDTTI